MSKRWNPTKKEIEDWLDQKLHKFVVQENKTPQISEKKVVGSLHIHRIHEIFFMSFSTKLYEWIVRLADSQGWCRLDQPIMWNPKLVSRLEASEDKIAQAVDHWLDQIIGGFITKFAIDTTVSYSKAERRFLKGPRGKYIKSLNTWIKMLLCEKRAMQIH